MNDDDEEATNPVILLDQVRLAKGSKTLSYRALPPALVTGDWLVSPTGEEGYIAGRSLDNPGNWLFIIKTGPSGWDSKVVEMTGDAFIGFRKKKHEESPLDDEAV